MRQCPSPSGYSADGGFYDAVNPTTGSIGQRRLVLDQSMIMAAVDNALNNNAIQRYFAKDPISPGLRASTARDENREFAQCQPAPRAATIVISSVLASGSCSGPRWLTALPDRNAFETLGAFYAGIRKYLPRA
jgi:hypothetical protein